MTLSPSGVREVYLLPDSTSLNHNCTLGWMRHAFRCACKQHSSLRFFLYRNYMLDTPMWICQKEAGLRKATAAPNPAKSIIPSYTTLLPQPHPLWFLNFPNTGRRLVSAERQCDVMITAREQHLPLKGETTNDYSGLFVRCSVRLRRTARGKRKARDLLRKDLNNTLENMIYFRSCQLQEGLQHSNYASTQSPL